MQRITLTTVSSSIICTRRNAVLGCCCGKSSQLYIQIPYNTLCSPPNCTFQRSFQKITYAIIFSDDKTSSSPFFSSRGSKCLFRQRPKPIDLAWHASDFLSSWARAEISRSRNQNLKKSKGYEILTWARQLLIPKLWGQQTATKNHLRNV